MGAFYNATKMLIGTPSTTKGFFYHSIERNKRNYENKTGRRNHFEYNWEVVVKYNEKYAKYIEGEKNRLGESSDEFQMAYNLKWILQRGMFIEEAKLEEICDNERETVHTGFSKTYVAGLDLGKASDSTVVTIAEVDYSKPIIAEKSDKLDVPDFVVYETNVVFWAEMQGDDWEEQYPMIMNVLNSFNIIRLVIDSTGVGAPIADRISANVPFEVIPYVLGTSSKSILYKHLDGEIKSGRVSIPASPSVRENREFEKFYKQMIDLQKTYSGPYMVVSHPDGRGFFDDYADSLALAVWGARGESIDKPITEKSPLREADYLKIGFYNSRNTITARRK